MRALLNTVANPVVGALLRSPLHGLLSGRMLLLTVTGRRSGRRMTFPVGYTRAGDVLTVVSDPAHRWWHNLRGGAEVELVLRGRARSGWGAIMPSGAAPAMVVIHIRLR